MDRELQELRHQLCIINSFYKSINVFRILNKSRFHNYLSRGFNRKENRLELKKATKTNNL